MLAAITYAIFDPWRVFSVTNKLTSRYSLDGYASAAQDGYKWITNIICGRRRGSKSVYSQGKNVGWTEREQQETRLESLLQQIPESLVLVTGPKGIPKTYLKALENQT